MGDAHLLKETSSNSRDRRATADRACGERPAARSRHMPGQPPWGRRQGFAGHRPALPDTIPIISPSSKMPGVFYATGHGHLGLTYSATTARLIADMVAGVKTSVDIKPFRINRY